MSATWPDVAMMLAIMSPFIAIVVLLGFLEWLDRR